MIGRQPVPEGRSEDVVVTLAAIYATRTMHAVLYEDAGQTGAFEVEVDLPMMTKEGLVMTSFDQLVE